MLTFVLVMFLWIFSVCLHEFAHAWVAYDGGDTSVKEKGYLSMNPLKYLDPVNSVILPVVFLMLGGIGLPGAAVYIDRSKLKSANRESAVSLAGPAANLFLLLVISAVLNLTPVGESLFAPPLAFLALLQASAVVLNLLPIPGFDGYGALSPHLSVATRARWDQYGRYAIWILLLLLFFVPPFRDTFWGAVRLLTESCGISSAQAWRGYQDFRFW